MTENKVKVDLPRTFCQEALLRSKKVRGEPQAFLEEVDKLQDALPKRVDANPKNLEKGLAKLVLTLIELIRKLLEKQAMRRMEGGSLTDEEVERLGETFIKLEDKMKELKKVFGLKDEELNIDLGPLGDLM